jgi:uncharacterized membrane protein YkoI
MDKIVGFTLSTMTTPKKFVNKKVMLISAIIGVGIVLSAIFIASPLGYSWAQQHTGTNTTNMNEYGAIPQINGSVGVRDNIQNFFKENTKIPFTMAAETAQKQIANGTVLGGHLGVAQGYLIYTYFVIDPAKETGHKVIIDAGNGQVLYTSEGQSLGSFGPSHMFRPFGPWKGHGFGGFWHGLFGP